MDQIYHKFLHVFSVDLGVIINKFFADFFLCVLYVGSV